MINGDIVLTVLSTQGNQTKIGIQAPRDHVIMRDELYSGCDHGTVDTGKGLTSGSLVLGRKAGESIYINNDIVITVVSISGNTVKLSFNAPKSVKIMCEELL